VAREVLKDSHGVKVGTLDNGVSTITAYNPQGVKVGHYDKAHNITYAAGGRKVGTGNLLTSLL